MYDSSHHCAEGDAEDVYNAVQYQGVPYDEGEECYRMLVAPQQEECVGYHYMYSEGKKVRTELWMEEKCEVSIIQQ